MKFVRFGLFAGLVFFGGAAIAIPVGAQAVTKRLSAKGPSVTDFEPLQLWKNAVIAGNRTLLSPFYSTSPAAQAKTPQGQTTDPSEEPAFWSTVRAHSAGNLNLKILEVKTLQPGVMAFVLRLETKIRSDSEEKPGVISFSQIWGQVNGTWRIFATQRSDLVPTGPLRLPQPAKPNTQLYPDPGVAQSEIAEAFRAAERDHKRVILIFGGNWCYDCHVLDATFRSKLIAPMVAASYHVVHVNIGDYDKNLDIARKYNVPLNKGVPSLAVLNPDGSLIFSQKSGEFENTGRIGPEDVTQFLIRWKPQR